MSEDENLFEVDLFALDEEWKNQPILYYRFAERLREHQRSRDVAKSDLEHQDARLATHFRNYWKTHGLEKPPNNDQVAEFVNQNEFHLRAVRFLRTCNDHVTKAQNAVNALGHKKKSLEKLSELYIGEYFSVPKERSLSKKTKRKFKHMGEMESAADPEFMERPKEQAIDPKKKKKKKVSKTDKSSSTKRAKRERRKK